VDWDQNQDALDEGRTRQPRIVRTRAVKKGRAGVPRERDGFERSMSTGRCGTSAVSWPTLLRHEASILEGNVEGTRQLSSTNTLQT